MTVCDMKTGEEGIIERVELSREVCERLRYLGASAGGRLTLLKRIFKKTYLIHARSAKIAIGREVAEGIIICRK